MITSLFRQSRQQRIVAELYGRIVTQSRDPGFYLQGAQQGGVPDTVEGRFELIALHGWMVMRRLRDGGAALADFNQALFDFLFADMDRNLRELGVSDMKIGAKVKDLATHFYGRVAAYEAGVAPSAEPGALEAALDRNLFGSTLPEPQHVAVMAAYVRSCLAHLQAQPLERLQAGEAFFPALPAVPVQGV
ncbi:ubiquinol-cytochrome C chaperone family protein [Oleisolibacter albus]|uniref:ubiquinol-cytochrome C chaperone family protein n=1 Tax=Oleisolibacter albus TaxID=2171757 RepID=UPI00138FF324|nr:ubiquinol-cytochrome C chaperone family protein [Oleisolibacter albus]